MSKQQDDVISADDPKILTNSVARPNFITVCNLKFESPITLWHTSACERADVPRDDTTLTGRVCDALHTEWLPATCLPIRKYSTIVAFCNTLQKWQDNIALILAI